MTTSDFTTAKISYNLVKRKGIFSDDGRLYLVPAESTVRVYLVLSGTLVRSLYLPHQIGHFVNLQLSPENPQEHVLAFSEDGHMVVFDYANSGKPLSLARLEISNPKDRPAINQLVFGRVFQDIEGDEDNPVTSYRIYYGLRGITEAIYQIESESLIVPSSYEPPDETTRILRSAKKAKTRDGGDAVPKLSNSYHRVDIAVNRDPTWPKRLDYCVDFDRAGSYVVVGYENVIKAIRLLPKDVKHEYSHHRFMTSFETNLGVVALACHPTDQNIFACADSTGRIFIWYRVLDDRHPTKTVLHWHQGLVGSICFTPNGSYLLSGGVEGVLCRWSMGSTNEKNHLPRIGVHIRHVVLDRRNQTVALAHEDNTLQFLSTDFKKSARTLVGSLVDAAGTNQMYPLTDLGYHSLTDSIILNASNGHLQFYSHHQQQLLYRVDIVQRNYLPIDTVNKIFNVELIKFAISPNGKWLATVEMRDDRENSIELRLKFFRVDPKGKFVLNTTVHCAHNARVTSMQFSNDSKMLVTAGDDLCFKIWALDVEPRPQNEPILSWNCALKGSRNSVAKPSAVSFSADGSLLAAVFDKVVTFWVVAGDNLQFKETVLVDQDPNTDENLQAIHFCQLTENRHLFIEVREHHIKIWNLLTLTIQYSRKIEKGIKRAVFDPYTDRIAIITNSNDLMLLPLQLSTDLIRMALPDKVENLIFAPFADASRIIYLNGRAELVTVIESDLEHRVHNDVHLAREMADTDLTPYAKMLVEAKRNELLTGMAETKPSYGRYLPKYVDSSKVAEEMFLKVPSHVLPPMDKICGQFLDILLGGNEEEEHKVPKQSARDSWLPPPPTNTDDSDFSSQTN